MAWTLGELERLGHQPVLGGGGVVAGPDQGDDLVDHVERLDAALEDVLAVAGPCCRRNFERRVIDLDLVVDVAVQRLRRGSACAARRRRGRPC